MRVTAAIIALTSALPESGWTVPWAKRSLKTVATNLRSVQLTDDMAIITDDAALIERENIDGVPVQECPAQMRGHKFNFLSLEAYKTFQELELLKSCGLDSDVAFIVKGTLPLLSPHTLERMYHALMEDPVAGRIVPIVKEDPQLFTRFPGQETFFPVWAHKGMDRQRIPQLYQCRSACILHVNRLTKSIPCIKGLHVERKDLHEACSQQDFLFVDYMLSK